MLPFLLWLCVKGRGDRRSPELILPVYQIRLLQRGRGEALHGTGLFRSLWATRVFRRKPCCRATTAVSPVLTINLIILIFMTVCAILAVRTLTVSDRRLQRQELPAGPSMPASCWDGQDMKHIVRTILIALAPAALAATDARADSIFDVEHARAMYRAGSASQYDMEQLRRWGRPSGYYPQYGPPRPRRIDLRRWTDRRW